MNFENPEVTALEGIARLEGFWKSLGLPLTFAELGAKAEDIAFMAGKINLPSGRLGKFCPLSREEIVEVYQLAL